MIYRNVRLYFLVIATSLIGISSVFAEFPEKTKDIFDEIYSVGRFNKDLARKLILKINQTNFDRESHRVMALIQVKSSTEDPELLEEAIVIAKSYIDSNADRNERDLVKIALSAILSLSGDRTTGCKIAEEMLTSLDFEQMANENRAYVDYISKRYNLESFGPDRFFKDGLRRQIGGYYLNRKDSEGGPDLQKSCDVYSEITVPDIKDSCLLDSRLRGLKPSLSANEYTSSDPVNSGSKNQLFYEDSSKTKPGTPKHTGSTNRAVSKNATETVAQVVTNPARWLWVGGLFFLMLVASVIIRVRLYISKKLPNSRF